jgi:hypothetical protein
MTPPRDDLTGVDDFIAELSFARRALQRHLGDCTLCGRRFTHPRRPTEFDALGYLVTDTCVCVRPSGHDHGCLCEHNIERHVYGVDLDGREEHRDVAVWRNAVTAKTARARWAKAKTKTT